MCPCKLKLNSFQDRAKFHRLIHGNVLMGMQNLTKAMQQLGLTYEKAEALVNAKALLATDYRTITELTPEQVR